MGMGPAPAIRAVLAKTGLSLAEVDLIEINEAFAAQYLSVEKELGLDRDRVNVNGGAIAIGHPLGMSGTRLLLTLLLELRRRGEEARHRLGVHRRRPGHRGPDRDAVGADLPVRPGVGADVASGVHQREGSSMSEIKTVGVLGCGLMGAGIAQVAAMTGHKSLVLEVNQGVLDKGLARVRKFLDDGVAKGKVAAEVRDTTLANLSGTTTFADLKDCDIVIEAIIENLEEKRKAYAALEEVVGPHTIFCSNTSSLCIMELAAASKRPDRFAGLHFFNPVPLMKLVEVIDCLTTSEETHQRVLAFGKALGKETITAPDKPGFIVNRLLIPYLLDAIRAYEHGLGTVEDIDNGMKLGCGYPMGPFALLDFVGLDTTYFIANIMFEEYREPAYAPPPLLKRMVLAGRLGRKSGHGFYKY